QENHSFNEVLGRFCRKTGRCAYAAEGEAGRGHTIPLQPASDRIPSMGHTTEAQLTALDDGRMDGFYKMTQCAASTGYACYRWYRPGQIPNLNALARRFAISD